MQWDGFIYTFSVDAFRYKGYLQYFSIVTSCRLCKTCLKREMMMDASLQPAYNWRWRRHDAVPLSLIRSTMTASVRPPPLNPPLEVFCWSDHCNNCVID